MAQLCDIIIAAFGGTKAHLSLEKRGKDRHGLEKSLCLVLGGESSLFEILWSGLINYVCVLSKQPVAVYHFK